jgi:hypothetical protein
MCIPNNDITPVTSQNYMTHLITSSGITRNFFQGGGSTNSVEDRGQREWGSGGSGLLVRVSGGNCDLVQEISYAAYTLYLYSYSPHGSIYSGLYSCSLGYVCEFLLFLYWLPLNLVILLQMYFPRNWEFSLALSKLRNLGGGGLKAPPRYATDY